MADKIMKICVPLLSIAAGAALCAAQTIYLAGDSTAAKGGGGRGTQGWGEYLGQYVTIPVVNRAVAGRSARSGDFVIIEFGHNDGRSGAIDNGRQDAYGSSYSATATVVTSSNQTVVIHTFPFYIQNAVTALVAKGAIPIVASRTPNNSWWGTSIVQPPRFVEYARIAAERTGVTFIDHYAFVAQAYEELGETAVSKFYPIDHTHTSPAGASVVAEAFVRGLLCAGNSLRGHLDSASKAIGCSITVP